MKASVTAAALPVRLRNALAERTLAVSSLKPVDRDGDLRLESELHKYEENVIATDADGRTRQFQFTITASFVLYDKSSQRIWQLDHYQYSDQFQLSTTSSHFRDEAVFEQDQSMKTIADLVITNLALALAERGHHE